MLRRLVMLWGRYMRNLNMGNMHIRNADVRDADIRNVDVRNVDIRNVYWRNVDVGYIHRRDMVMVATMAMVCWCASFLPSYSINSFCKDLSHDFSLPPPNCVVLFTKRVLAVLSYRPCRVASIGLATVRP